MHPLLYAASGGVMVGAALGLLLLAHGRIGGFGGITAGLLPWSPGDVSWRALFLISVVLGAGLAAQALPDAVVLHAASSMPRIVLAGLLVGIGTTLGNGCTSGHGICGVARFSPRSLIAVLTFSVSGSLAFYASQAMAGAR